MGRERMGKRGAEEREEEIRRGGGANSEACCGELTGSDSEILFVVCWQDVVPGSISPAIQFRTLQFWEAHAAAAV